MQTHLVIGGSSRRESSCTAHLVRVEAILAEELGARLVAVRSAARLRRGVGLGARRRAHVAVVVGGEGSGGLGDGGGGGGGEGEGGGGEGDISPIKFGGCPRAAD